MGIWNDSDDEFEDTAVNAGPYRPEGNEEGILKEYIFTLNPKTLNEGLCFLEDEELEDTFVPGHPPAVER